MSVDEIGQYDNRKNACSTQTPGIPLVPYHLVIEPRQNRIILTTAWMKDGSIAGVQLSPRDTRKLAEELRQAANMLEPQSMEEARLTADYFVEIDQKYAVSDGALRNRKGEPVPVDEPVIVFRARDILSVKALEAYYEACMENPSVSQHHVRGVSDLLAKWKLFARDHADRMKIPD